MKPAYCYYHPDSYRDSCAAYGFGITHFFVQNFIEQRDETAKNAKLFAKRRKVFAILFVFFVPFAVK